MSTGVKSDGKNQELFDAFLETFDKMTRADADKAISWFAEKKENGRERLDDVRLPSVCGAIYKYYSRFGEAPAVLKRYAYIKLKQGKRHWERNSDPMECVQPKFPWDN